MFKCPALETIRRKNGLVAFKLKYTIFSDSDIYKIYLTRNKTKEVVIEIIKVAEAVRSSYLETMKVLRGR